MPQRLRRLAGRLKTAFNVAFIALLLASIVPVAMMVGQDEHAARSVTHLRFMYWGGPEQMAQELEVHAAFRRQMAAEGRPDIDVELIPAGARYGTKLQAMISSHDAPDVFMVSPGSLVHYADRETPLIVDITERVARDRAAERGVPASQRQLDFDDLLPEAVRTFYCNGRLWGFPRDFKATGIAYNADLLAAVGLADPNDLYARNEWTWETFRGYLEKLNQPGKVFGLFQDAFSEAYWANILYQAGGGVWSDDGHDLLIDRPESLAGLQFVYDLAWTWKLVRPWSAELGSAEPWEARQTAMTGLRGWHVPSRVKGTYDRYAGTFRFAWDVAPWPLGPKMDYTPQRVTNAAGKLTGWRLASGCVVRPAAVVWLGGREGEGPFRLRQCTATGVGYVMSVDSRHPDEAWRLLKFLVSPEAQRIRASFTLATVDGPKPIAGVNMPSRRSVEPFYLDMARRAPVRPVFSGCLESKNRQELWPRVDVFVQGRYYGRSSAASIVQEEVGRELDRQFQRMIATAEGGRVKPEEVARQTRRRAEAVRQRVIASPFANSFNTPSMIRPASDDPLGLAP